MELLLTGLRRRQASAVMIIANVASSALLCTVLHVTVTKKLCAVCLRYLLAVQIDRARVDVPLQKRACVDVIAPGGRTPLHEVFRIHTSMFVQPVSHFAGDFRRILEHRCAAAAGHNPARAHHNQSQICVQWLFLGGG